MSQNPLVGGRSVQSRSQSNSVAKGIVVTFYVFLTIEYIRPQDVFPIIGVVRPALICVIILGIFSLTRLDADVFKDRSIRLFIAFVALCWFGVIHAVNNFHAFNTSFSMTAYLVGAVIPMCLIIRSEPQLRSLVTFWVAAHCYLAVYGLLHSGRGPGSFLADENDLALALNAALPYAFIVSKDPGLSRFKRFAFLLVAVVITAGVVATSSRGGFVGLIVTTAGLVWFSKERVRNALLIILAAVCFFFAVPEEYKSEIRSINDTEDSTRQGRLYQWGIGWDMFVDNPIIGVGTANYPWRVVEYELQSEDFVPGQRLYGGRVAHSLYFTLFPEHGVVGVTIFFLILWEVLKKLKINMSRAKRDSDEKQETLVELFSRATMVSLLAFLTTGIFISVLYYPIYWHIIGFAFCAWVIGLKKAGSDRREDAS
ncbi:MAG: O-antigen ligase family protein [Chloroflexota bacterium]